MFYRSYFYPISDGIAQPQLVPRFQGVIPWRIMQYEQYLQTDHWKGLKRQYYLSHNKMCFLCNSYTNVELHHRSYERLWHERITDLVPLCRFCHETTHRILKNKFKVGGPKTTLWNVVRKLKYRLPGGRGEVRTNKNRFTKFRKKYRKFIHEGLPTGV